MLTEDFKPPKRARNPPLGRTKGEKKKKESGLDQHSVKEERNPHPGRPQSHRGNLKASVQHSSWTEEGKAERGHADVRPVGPL